MVEPDLKFLGWCEALDSIRASLRSYPWGGGDKEIMELVEAIEIAAIERGCLARHDEGENE